MVLRILKRDMRRRKSVNLILFLFITLASVFLSSSMNNILTVFPAVEYYMDYANVPDITFITMGAEESDDVGQWIEEAPGVEEYGRNAILMLGSKDVMILRNQKEKLLDANSVTMYLGTMDSEFCKVFNTDGEEFTLKPGEIALSLNPTERNELQPGDKIRIKSGDKEKVFTFKFAMKDAVFGHDMVGMTRLMVSQEDYDMFEDGEEKNIINMNYIDTSAPQDFLQDLNNEEFSSAMNSIERSTFTMTYSFDMIMAALLILIGICLILIALLVLRFTLVFTLEEDHREIGIMKAMGLRDFAVKKLYLLKYLVLVSLGALLGLLVSLPVSKMMVKSVSRNMIMQDAGANIWVNVICTALIIALVMLFCYSCTRKLGKVSAITAIRGGQTGERFKRRGGLRLYKRKHMPVPVFLSVNDMLSHMKRYLVLLVTFCISFILITIPLNTLNTMKSEEMAERFAINPDCAVYVTDIEKPGETDYKSLKDLNKGMKRIKEELDEKGYKAELTGIPIFFIQFWEKGVNEKNNIMTIQNVGPNHDYLTYSEGVAPRLDNEVAFSETIMDLNEWKIGDTVEAVLDGKEKSFLITGIYSDYLQMGSSARLNPEIDMDNVLMFGYWNVMVDMDTDKTQAELADELNTLLPDYEWADAQRVVDRNVGGIQDSLKEMLIPMTGMLCAIIMLITLLMQRLFIVREKGEIAMMKSVGFRNSSIRLWQVIRMVLVAVVSMVAAVPISLLSNQFILKPIFAIMGADVTIQVVPWQVYGVYPGVLMLGIIIATLLAASGVKKINIRELNNLE